ncbi:hypothetical protein GE061_015484 [Apolygus lucorum]|uniref:DOMON domain-containing protein n=1 Tax=Apolygus lucorum TaxID=248454 RepID=A0A8S9XQ64_APOLU|nr:hypothetical protein GE061_015484 [Apolygus lucorum]
MITPRSSCVSGSRASHKLYVTSSHVLFQSKLNCEVLSDDLAFEVRWAVAGDSVVIQLVAKLENGEYMSFGLSGEYDHSVMVGGDVVVAWVDQRTLNGYAHDYYLDAKSQCAGTRGSCPDYRIEPNTESVRLLNAALVNGYSIVTYQRPLRAHDGLDRPILTNQSQPIIWAVGPLNGQEEVSYHSVTSKGDVFIDFGRAPKWNCPIPESDTSEPQPNHHSEDLAQHESIQNVRNPPQQSLTTERTVYKTPPPPQPVAKVVPWDIPPIQCNEPEDGVFYAQMGPTGGKRGYPAITGHVGWGIAYYINGLLIPEIHVVRGRTYSFVVEGGMDPNIPAKFHPFYITDDPVGGYQHKTPEERRKVNIYAGAELNKHGEVVPTGLGRLCNWNPDPDHSSDEFASFGAYQRTLTLVCDHGEPAVVQWTPDKDTPDTVYYQCFSHRYLGWKITVHDSCDLGHHGAASEQVSSIASLDDELLAKPSIVVTTRVKPDFGPQSINDDFKDTVHDVKDASFGNKAPAYAVVDHNNFENKDKFPYEIYKPSTNEFRPNMTDAVIPVKEEIEDIPETTTFKMTVVTSNSTSVSTSFPSETSLPLIKGPLKDFQRNPHIPFRGPFPQPNGPGFGQQHPGRRPVTVMIRRPAHPMMKPQNQPHNQHVPMMSRPPQMIHHSASQSRPVIMKKPVVRLPQRPMIIGPPPPPPPPSQQQNQRPLVGPVMQAHPQPPQPPPMPSRPPKPTYVHKFKKPLNPLLVTPIPDKTKYKILPSQMISQKAEDSTTRLPIAVNTGFNPGSLVIESGFKPIINSPQAEERVSDLEYDDEENVEGVIKMDSLDEQKSQTEMFEPMFIPSPLDSNVKHVKKATTEPVKKVRKPYRQVVVRRPVYNDEPLFRSEPDEVDDESNEKSDHYSSPERNSGLNYEVKELSNDAEPEIPSNHKPESKKQQSSGDVSEPSALPLVKEESSETKASSANDRDEDAVQVVTVTATTIVEESSETVKQDEVEVKRKRREAHHEVDHDGSDHSEHDHSHHDHDHSMHDHSNHEESPKKNSSVFLTPTIFLVALMSLVKFF